MTEPAHDFQWRRVNSESFEYAIRKGLLGDEFVKNGDGSCLRRAIIDVPAENHK